jgi:type IV secretory pathway VirB3-like protein
MERYWPYEEEYQVTGATVYKGGSRANLIKGVRVRIMGHGYVASTVLFLK